MDFYKPFFIENRERILSSKFDLVRLRAISTAITKGETPLWKGDEYKDEGILFVKSENVLAGSLSLSKRVCIDDDVHQRMRRSQLQKGDVLLNIVGASIGRSCVYDRFESANINQAVCLIRPSRVVNPHWLCTVLNSDPFQTVFDRIKSGGARDNIDLYQVRALRVPFSPPEVQNRIAEAVDSAYAQKRQKEQEADSLLASIDEYIPAQLGIEMPAIEAKKCYVVYAGEIAGKRVDPFYYQNSYDVLHNQLRHTSSVKRLGDLLQMIESGSRPKGGVANIKSGALSFGGEHINNQCEIEVNRPKYIPHEFHSLHKRTATQLNDLLLVKDGATTGKIGIVQSKEHIGQNINEHLFLLRPRDNVNAVYLLSYLNSCFGKFQIKREITGGTVTGITRNVVKQLRIILPDPKKQIEIADHIAEIRKHAKALQQEGQSIVEEAKREAERVMLVGMSG